MSLDQCVHCTFDQVIVDLALKACGDGHVGSSRAAVQLVQRPIANLFQTGWKDIDAFVLVTYLWRTFFRGARVGDPGNNLIGPS